MAFIVETIAGDRRLQLAGEEFVRPMRIGTSWTRVRIGLRLQFIGTTTATNAILMIGVCQGVTNTFNNGNTTDYLGVQVGASATPNWTYSTSYANHFACTNAGYIVRRQGNSNTVGASGTLSYANIGTVNHSVCFVDITKGSPNYTVAAYFQPENNGLASDISIYDFLAGTEVDTTPASATSILNANSFAYSGSSLFDTVSVYWNRATPVLEICDICVVRLY